MAPVVLNVVNRGSFNTFHFIFYNLNNVRFNLLVIGFDYLFHIVVAVFIGKR